jgi:hypothetical protein
VEDILFIISASNEDTGTAQLVHRVLHESSRTYPQLSNVRSLKIPLQRSLLQDWSSWLASEVIDQWVNLRSTGISVDAVLLKLGFAESENKTSALLAALNAGSAGVSVSLELLSRINSIRDQHTQLNYSQTELQKWLEQKNIELSNWLSPPQEASFKELPPTGLNRVRFNAEALHIKTQLNFKEALVSWRQAGLNETLQFLQVMGEKLTHAYASYDQQRQTYKSKEDSAWRAFNNLRTQLQQRSFMSRKRQVTFDSVLQGLLKAYSFKLEAEVYSQACQIVGKLKQAIHLLAFEFVQANDFLKRLKGEFIRSSPNEPFFAPLLQQFIAQHLEPIKFRREIEGVLGSPLNNWGSLRKSQEAIIRQQILSKLNPLCLEVYAQCYANLMSLQTSNLQTEPINQNMDSPDAITFSNGSQAQEDPISLQNEKISQKLKNQEQLTKQNKSSQVPFVVDDALNGDRNFLSTETP